jgi:hypothetical protein
MSNFAAMSFPVLGLLNAVSKATSKIIDGFLETAYAFLEVCVEYCIPLGGKILGEIRNYIPADRLMGAFDA